MSYLKQFDAAPDAEKWPLALGWINSDACLPFFAELREKRPILVTPECILFARYVDVIEVLRQPTTFTVELYLAAIGNYMLAQDETPMHTREKAIMHSMLNRDDIPNVRLLIAKRAGGFLDAGNGRIDLGQQYSRRVPIAVVQEYFGLDGVDPATMTEWSESKQTDAFRNQPFQHQPNSAELRQKSEAAGDAVAAYLGALLQRRVGEIQAGKAGDDIVTRMLQTHFPASVNFPIERLAANAGGLLIGAVETTSQAVMQAVRQLIKRPEILAKAKALADANDPAFDGYVWEALRWDPIGQYLFRYAAQDRVVAGGTDREVLVKKGTTVLPAILSAMFDPDLFPDPEQFDPTRPFENYFHFGYGEHECLGKYVGIVMIPEMVRQVILRPGLRAESDIDFAGTPYPQHYALAWNV